jgi:glyoxalase family protein
MRRVKMTSNFDDPKSAHWCWGVGDGKPGTVITYFERQPGVEPRARMGAGQTHHFALAVPDEDTQLEWREKLMSAGMRVSPVMDRIYFKSIYTNDPDGHIVELATLGPGFVVDEEPSALGQALKLPPWLEGYRKDIEATLHPIQVPEWHPLLSGSR